MRFQSDYVFADSSHFRYCTLVCANNINSTLVFAVTFMRTKNSLNSLWPSGALCFVLERFKCSPIDTVYESASCPCSLYLNRPAKRPFCSRPAYPVWHNRPLASDRRFKWLYSPDSLECPLPFACKVANLNVLVSCYPLCVFGYCLLVCTHAHRAIVENISGRINIYSLLLKQKRTMRKS